MTLVNLCLKLGQASKIFVLLFLSAILLVEYICRTVMLSQNSLAKEECVSFIALGNLGCVL